MHQILTISLLTVILSGCGGNSDPARLPPLPAENLLEAAETRAFRTLKASSFQQAFVYYPADGGTHALPIGSALATRLVRSFPPGANASGLRLDKWQAHCKEFGLFQSTIACTIRALASFQLQERVQEIAFGVSDLTLGDKALLSRETAHRTSFEQNNEHISDQLRRLIEATAHDFQNQLQMLLLADQNRRLF